MSGKIIAQIIISGLTIISKSLLTAYRQALQNAKAGGVSAPNNNIGTIIKHKMSIDEACKILNIEKNNLNKTVINERYKTMFEVNDPSKGGSFYLQSKIYRSKEVIDQEIRLNEEMQK